MTKPRAVIIDIDGTLAHRTGDRGYFDWSRVGEDEPDEQIIELAGAFAKDDYRIIICSGRMEYALAPTLDWLRQHNVPFDSLHMRLKDDYRKDDIVKEEMYHEQIEPFYDVRFVIDDRDQVVKMWRSIGLKCLQCAEGSF